MTPTGALDGPPAAPTEHLESRGGLVIRVWLEPGSAQLVRARVLCFSGNEEPTTWATAAGEAAVLDAVDRWIRAQVRAAAAP